MKNVKVINSILLLFIFFCSCKPVISKKTIEKKILDNKDSLKYPHIETNSLKNGFDKNLINTLVVKEKDTVLFRKWGSLEIDSIYLTDKFGVKFKIKGNSFVSYYKTGKNKFSTYQISVENMKTKLSNNIFGYANHKTYKNPYRMDYINGHINIEKISSNLGRFKISNPNSLGDYIYFTVSDNYINLIQLENLVNTRGRRKNYSYILDTLIPINSKNKFIDIKKLNKALRADKNRRK